MYKTHTDNIKSFFIPFCLIRENGTCPAPSKALEPLQLCFHGASVLKGLGKPDAEYVGALSFQGLLAC